MNKRNLILAAVVMVVAAVRAGSHTAQSGTFSVNTRATTTVKVTGVTSRWCDGAYGGGGRHVYFLAGVGYDFGIGVIGLPIEFTAQVDWGGKTGSWLEFNGINNGMSDSRTIDVSALPVGGKLEVVAVASDGTRSAPFRANFDVAPKPDVFGVALSAEVSLPGSDQLDYSTPSLNFSPFEAIGGSLHLPRDVPGLSGEEMKIAPSFKVSVKVNGNAGTMHVKPAIGEKGGIKINGTQSRQPNGQFGKMAGLEAGLYVEADIIATYKQDKWELSQTYVGLEVDGKYKTPPVYYGIFYGRLDVEANVFLSYQIKALSPSGTPESDFRFSSEALPKITLVAGVGASGFVAGEIYGGGGGILDVRGGPPIVLHKLGAKAQIGGRLVIIGYGSMEKDFWTGTYWIKNTELGIDRLGLSSMASPLMMLSEGVLPLNLTALDKHQFQPLSRDYQKRNSLKTLAMANPMPRLLALTGGSETVLMADGYPYPEPAVVSVGVTNHVLYVRDNAGRLTENRTELVDVFNAGEGWSAAVPVWDDGTGDFSPQVAALSNGTLLAVWANGRAALTNGATLDEALAGLEIGVGERDPVTGVWTCRNLTANAYLDHSPMLSVAPDGSAMTAWIRNRNQNPLGTPDEPNRMLFSRRVGGVWAEEDYVAVNLGTVTYCDLAYNGTQAAIVFSMDNDGDLETQGDQEIYGCTFNGSQWGPYVRLTSNAVQDTRPYVRYDAEGQLLVVWYQDSKVMSATGLALTDPVTVGDMGIGSGAQDFKLATGPAGELAIIWPGAGAAGVASPDPYIMNYDPQQKLWSRHVRLLEDPALERGFSGAFGADGRLRLAYSKVAISEDANGVPVFGAVDLCVLDHSIGPDPAIAEYGIALSTNSVSVGESVGISVTVENRGDLAVSNLAVCVYEGNPATGGVLLGETQRVAQVLGGTSAVVTVTWTLPDAVSNVVLYAAVDPGLETDDRNRANNTATLAALMPDLSVDGASALNESTNVRLIKASVMNEGAVPVVAGTQVTFRRGASDGALLAEDTLGALVFGSNGVYDAGFRWDMGGTVFTSAFEVVYIAVDPSNLVAEIEERNNTTVVQVMTSLDTDGDGLLDGEEQRLGTRVDLADTDGDGLSDTAEVRTHGTNPLIKDSDGDGSNDAQEIAAGTDPNSATDIFKIVAADGSVDYVMSVTWNAKSGSVYRVEAAPAVAGGWGDAPTGAGDYGASLQTAVSNGVLRYCDTQGGVTNRYYRVRLVTP
jgi:hypothetical protein